MRISVLGAAGKMSAGVIRDLADASEVESIILIDLPECRPEMERRAGAWCGGKAEVRVADILDGGSLRQAITGSRALANCTTHRNNLLVMDACLDAGVNYVDMGGLYHVARKQLERHAVWKERGLTAVLGMGSAPGIVNVMSRYAADMLDTVETVRITDGIVNFTKTDVPIVIPYALGTLLDEFIMNPFVFENGEWKELAPFSGAELIDFPPPVGPQTVFCTLHSEVATIPISFRERGIRNVSFKLALPGEFEKKLRFLVDLGMGGDKPLDVKGMSVTPRDFIIALADKLPRPTAEPDDHKVLRVDVEGEKDGRHTNIRVEMICDPFQPWGMGAGPHSVGVPVGVASRLLASGAVTERGAMGAEACVPPLPFFARLDERSLHATVMVRQDIL